MRIIAFMNQKGGVGKTTTCASLGAALAELGKKVCLIDVDPQAHLTINFGVEPADDQPNLYDVLTEQATFAQALHRIDDHLSILPGSIDLAGAEIELVSVIGREQILKKRLAAAPLDFDYILLDCPPSLGLLTINSLAVATEVIIPMQAHFLALQGVGKLLETVALVNKRMNPALKVAGIVLTMFDAQTKLSAEVVNDINSFLTEARGKPLPWAEAVIYKTKIRRNIKLAECPSFGQTILNYDALSNGAADYRALAREIAGLKPAPAAVTVTTTTAPAASSPPPTPIAPSGTGAPPVAGEAGAPSPGTAATGTNVEPSRVGVPAHLPAATSIPVPTEPKTVSPAHPSGGTDIPVCVESPSAAVPSRRADSKTPAPKPKATLVPKGAVIPKDAIVARPRAVPAGAPSPAHPTADQSGR